MVLSDGLLPRGLLTGAWPLAPSRFEQAAFEERSGRASSPTLDAFSRTSCPLLSTPPLSYRVSDERPQQAQGRPHGGTHASCQPDFTLPFVLSSGYIMFRDESSVLAWSGPTSDCRTPLLHVRWAGPSFTSVWLLIVPLRTALSLDGR